MEQLAERLDKLQTEFADARIPTDQPGFYEEFQFVRRESKDPTYLDNYARFVQWQPYSDSYLWKAEEIIHVVAAELQHAMQVDGSAAAYDEIPVVMARILEREGVWSYVVHGAVTITFPISSGFAPYSFRAVDTEANSLKARGYTWLFAPPFQVVDLAIISQNYPDPVSHFLPKIILEKDTETTVGDPAEILTAGAIEEFRAEGLSLDEGLDRLVPGFRSRFAPDFPACKFSRNEAEFTFVPMRVVPTETPLEQITKFVSKGRSAMHIYDHDIRPRLLKEIA
jgi:hypothetical protein